MSRNSLRARAHSSASDAETCQWRLIRSTLERYVQADANQHGAFSGCDVSDVVQDACLRYLTSVGTRKPSSCDRAAIKRAANRACNSARTRLVKRSLRKSPQEELTTYFDLVPGAQKSGYASPNARLAGQPASVTPLEELARAEELRRLELSLSVGLAQLAPIEVTVLSKRFRGERFAQIGAAVGLTKQQAHRVYVAAVRKLAHCVRPDEWAREFDVRWASLALRTPPQLCG
jgi:DNA-directed RNA polymerase specialized sigma24 family protein